MRISVIVDEEIRRVTSKWGFGTISAFIRGAFTALFRHGTEERNVYSFLSGEKELSLRRDKNGDTE